jgi:hypothetical protein
MTSSFPVTDKWLPIDGAQRAFVRITNLAAHLMKQIRALSDQAQHLEQDGVSWNFTVNALAAVTAEALLKSAEYLEPHEREALACVSKWFEGIDREVTRLFEPEGVTLHRH